MKKLSDIGRMSAGYKATRTEDGKDVSWGACKEFIYSEAERRELVREGIKTFIIENTKDWELKAKLGAGLDRFLEEQGL
jgi:hypothetical protein